LVCITAIFIGAAQKQNAAVKRRFVYTFVYRINHQDDCIDKAILERATRLELVTSTLAR
jgi:hypothetical protein